MNPSGKLHQPRLGLSVTRLLTGLVTIEVQKLKPKQLDYYEKHVLLIYGILIGGELAAISEDMSDACAQAIRAKADPNFAADNVWQ